MLKDILNLENKPVDATFKAHAALVRGMGVTKALTGGVTAFISDGSTSGLYLVDAEDNANGLNAALEIRPESEYDAIKKDEFVKLVKYLPGEAFATDQCATLAVGDYAAPGKDGKFVKSMSSDTPKATALVCRGTVKVGSKTLTILEVIA